MTAATGVAPARRSRIPGAVALLARQVAQQAAAVRSRLSGSALTMVGLGCVDVGAFEAHQIAGWIVTGASVLLLDWVLE